MNELLSIQNQNDEDNEFLEDSDDSDDSDDDSDTELIPIVEITDRIGNRRIIIDSDDEDESGF